MSDYTWFKLLVRAAGLTMLVLTLPQAIGNIVRLVWHIVDWQTGTWPVPNPIWAQWIPTIATDVMASGLALYVTFGASRLIAYFIKEVHNKCPGCGHTLEGAVSPVCSECGGPIPVGARKPAEKPEGDGGAAT